MVDVTNELMSKLTSRTTAEPTVDSMNSENKILPKKFFISHSEIDKNYADKTIQMLKAMGVKDDDIFCTSTIGYDIDIGEDWKERLKTELHDNTFVIFLISDNFYSSPICFCEMGAAWILTKKHVPILIPPMDYSRLKGIISNTQGFYINEAKKWTKLKDQLQCTENNNARWEHRRDEILSTINATLKPAEDKIKEINTTKAILKADYKGTIVGEDGQIDYKIVNYLNIYSTGTTPLNAIQIAAGIKLEPQKVWERCIFLVQKKRIIQFAMGGNIETCRYFT